MALEARSSRFTISARLCMFAAVAISMRRPARARARNRVCASVDDENRDEPFMELKAAAASALTRGRARDCDDRRFSFLFFFRRSVCLHRGERILSSASQCARAHDFRVRDEARRRSVKRRIVTCAFFFLESNLLPRFAFSILQR